jgi:hypothetical protein
MEKKHMPDYFVNAARLINYCGEKGMMDIYSRPNVPFGTGGCSRD